MILQLRKIMGTVCLFLLLFIILYLSFDFIRVTNLLPIGEYSIMYGQLPDGSSFHISTTLVLILFSITSSSVISSYYFWHYLYSLSNNTAALVSMIPVTLLAACIALLQQLQKVTP